MPAGELTFPNANKIPERYNSGRWFDHYLNGKDNGVEKEPAVAYYVMGDTSTPGAPGNEWRLADDWPIPAKETPVYFTPDRHLNLKAPADGDAHIAALEHQVRDPRRAQVLAHREPGLPAADDQDVDRVLRHPHPPGVAGVDRWIDRATPW